MPQQIDDEKELSRWQQFTQKFIPHWVKIGLHWLKAKTAQEDAKAKLGYEEAMGKRLDNEKKRIELEKMKETAELAKKLEEKEAEETSIEIFETNEQFIEATAEILELAETLKMLYGTTIEISIVDNEVRIKLPEVEVGEEFPIIGKIQGDPRIGTLSFSLKKDDIESDINTTKNE